MKRYKMTIVRLLFMIAILSLMSCCGFYYTKVFYIEDSFTGEGSFNYYGKTKYSLVPGEIGEFRIRLFVVNTTYEHNRNRANSNVFNIRVSIDDLPKDVLTGETQRKAKDAEAKYIDQKYYFKIDSLIISLIPGMFQKIIYSDSARSLSSCYFCEKHGLSYSPYFHDFDSLVIPDSIQTITIEFECAMYDLDGNMLESQDFNLRMNKYSDRIIRLGLN